MFESDGMQACVLFSGPPKLCLACSVHGDAINVFLMNICGNIPKQFCLIIYFHFMPFSFLTIDLDNYKL